jgi:hypothetical protein
MIQSDMMSKERRKYKEKNSEKMLERAGEEESRGRRMRICKAE